MPKPTLGSLGIRPFTVPFLKNVLTVQDKLNQIRKVHASVRTGTGDLVSRRLEDVAVGGGDGATKRAGKKMGARAIAKANTDAFHEVRRLLDERAFYPAHDARKESAAYSKIHKKLVKEYGCLICGVTQDILAKPATREDLNQNPYAAKQLETHHHVIEWALANAIDTDKFNKFVFPHLKARHPDRYTNPLTDKEVRDWVDHSEDNLWVLCDVHHRAKYFGIHEITDPLWGPQDIFNDAFLKQVRDTIKAGDGKPSGKGKATSKANGRKLSKAA